MTLGTPWQPPVPSYLSTSPPQVGDTVSRPVASAATAAPATSPAGAACMAAQVTFPAYALVRRLTVQAPSRCIARVYVGTPAAETLASATRSGDLDENDCGANPIPVPEGTSLWVLWDTQVGPCTVRVEAEVH